MDKLTDEQLSVFKNLEKGNNVYLRGSAGTGKTYTIICLKEWAKRRYIRVGITAMTGCAALLINGSTLHSFLGIGLASKTAEELAQNTLGRRAFFVKKLKAVKMLVIDEVSMLDKTLFEKISKYLQIIRKLEAPFGGIQVVLCGDFCQLPPVKGEYCFKSDLWNELNLKECYLTKSFRQANDSTFQNLLESIREGKLSNENCDLLYKLQQTEFKYGIEPTKLYPLCANIDQINENNFNKLIKMGNKEMTYKTSISELAKKDPIWVEQQKIPEKIHLCVGCQVFVTHNISVDTGLVNGTRGVIKELTESSVIICKTNGVDQVVPFHSVCHEDDKENIWIEFMPLRLAFALTIHKSQGMTLDAIEIDLGKNIFEYGQAYTAISRAKNLSSIRLIHFDNNVFKTHSDVLKLYNKS